MMDVTQVRRRRQLRRDVLAQLYSRLPQARNDAGMWQRDLAEPCQADETEIELALWMLAGAGAVVRDGNRVRITPQGAESFEQTLLEEQ